MNAGVGDYLDVIVRKADVIPNQASRGLTGQPRQPPAALRSLAAGYGKVTDWWELRASGRGVSFSGALGVGGIVTPAEQAAGNYRRSFWRSCYV